MDKDVTVIDGVDDLIRELRRQGNNLNQLVVMARQGHVELTPASLSFCQQLWA